MSVKAVKARASKAVLSPGQYPVGLCELKLNQQASRRDVLKVAEVLMLSSDLEDTACRKINEHWTGDGMRRGAEDSEWRD